jgi:hypothetical protein
MVLIAVRGERRVWTRQSVRRHVERSVKLLWQKFLILIFENHSEFIFECII